MPASYHTVSLQVSQDVSTAALSLLPLLCTCLPAAAAVEFCDGEVLWGRSVAFVVFFHCSSDLWV